VPLTCISLALSQTPAYTAICLDTWLLHCIVCLFMPKLSQHVLITSIHNRMARLSWSEATGYARLTTNKFIYKNTDDDHEMTNLQSSSTLYGLETYFGGSVGVGDLSLCAILTDFLVWNNFIVSSADSKRNYRYRKCVFDHKVTHPYSNRLIVTTKRESNPQPPGRSR